MMTHVRFMFFPARVCEPLLSRLEGLVVSLAPGLGLGLCLGLYPSLLQGLEELEVLGKEALPEP